MGVAGLSSLSRSLASAVFASPPTASYEEALGHFEGAELVEPGFWLKNQLNIAKCHSKVCFRCSAMNVSLLFTLSRPCKIQS